MPRKTYKTETNTELSNENVTVLNMLYGGQLYAYKLVANDGFVIYDATAERTYYDRETKTEKPYVYYCRNVVIPLRCSDLIKNYIAVEEAAIDKKFIH